MNCLGGHRKEQEGSASDWLDAALIRSPTPLSVHERVFHELLAAGPGIDPSLSAALYEVMLDVWHAYEDMIPTLEALQEIGVTVCLLSNAAVPIRTVLDREGITPLINGVVLSYERSAYGRRQRSR